MKRAWIDRLASPRTGAPLELDPVRVADDELVEGFLVSADEREVWPIVAGIAALPRDLEANLRAQGSVYRRTPVNDPRLARFLLGRAGTGDRRVAELETSERCRTVRLGSPTAPGPSRVHTSCGPHRSRLRLALAIVGR